MAWTLRVRCTRAPAFHLLGGICVEERRQLGRQRQLNVLRWCSLAEARQNAGTKNRKAARQSDSRRLDLVGGATVEEAGPEFSVVISSRREREHARNAVTVIK